MGSHALSSKGGSGDDPSGPVERQSTASLSITIYKHTSTPSKRGVSLCALSLYSAEARLIVRVAAQCARALRPIANNTIIYSVAHVGVATPRSSKGPLHFWQCLRIFSTIAARLDILTSARSIPCTARS